MTRSIPVVRPYTLPELPLNPHDWTGLYFNGASKAYVNCGNDASLSIVNNITIIVSILPQFPIDAECMIISRESLPPPSFANNWRFMAKIFLGGGGINWGFYANAAFVGESDSLVPLAINKLYRLAVTYDQVNVKMYTEGLLTNTDPKTDVLPTNDNVTIGQGTGGGQAFYTGIIYYGIIIAQVLTQNQINDIITGRILPTQFDCRLWHDYRLGHANDLSGNNNHGRIVNAVFV